MVPVAHTLAFANEELAAARAWAARRAIPLEWLPEQLELRAILTQATSGGLFYLRAVVDDYREIPPVWTFTNVEWNAPPARQYFPNPVAGGRFQASVFHANAVICAPFNRLAYREHQGPHDDWGGPTSWLSAGQPDQVRADHLADMLSVIYKHFELTKGRMT